MNSFSVIWAWIKGQGPALLAVERVVLTVAGLSGLLAFWQFWEEREDRRLDRISSLIIAIDTCDADFLNAASEIIDSRNPLDPKVSQSVYYRAAAVTTLMCHELNEFLATDSIAAQFDEAFWLRVAIAQEFQENPGLLEEYLQLDRATFDSIDQ